MEWKRINATRCFDAFAFKYLTISCTINIYNGVVIKLDHGLSIEGLNAWSSQREILKQRPPRSSRRRHHWPASKHSQADRPGVQERAGSTLRAASPVHPEDSVVVRQRRAEERPVEAPRSSLHSLRLLSPHAYLFLSASRSLSVWTKLKTTGSLYRTHIHTHTHIYIHTHTHTLSLPPSFPLFISIRESRVKTSRAAPHRPSPFWYTQYATYSRKAVCPRRTLAWRRESARRTRQILSECARSDRSAAWIPWRNDDAGLGVASLPQLRLSFLSLYSFLARSLPLSTTKGGWWYAGGSGGSSVWMLVPVGAL